DWQMIDRSDADQLARRKIARLVGSEPLEIDLRVRRLCRDREIIGNRTHHPGDCRFVGEILLHAESQIVRLKETLLLRQLLDARNLLSSPFQVRATPVVKDCGAKQQRGQSKRYTSLAPFDFADQNLISQPLCPFQSRFKLQLLLEVFEIKQEVFDVLIAFLTVFAQSATYDVIQLARRFTSVTLKRRRLTLQNRSNHVYSRRVREGRLASDHLVEHHTDAENVSTRIHL